jgi:PAS domain-containing protein
MFYPSGILSNVYLVAEEKVIRCNIRDISARKRAEAALLAKEENRGPLIKNLPAGAIVHVLDTGIVLCNPEASPLPGMSSDHMLVRMPTTRTGALGADPIVSACALSIYRH